MKEDTETELCPRDDIGAYVDGELSAAVAAELERHIAGCIVCGRSLREQRQFLAALSASLDDGKDIVLPPDFTKKIVSNAESSVTGLRRWNELLTAACISAALFLFAIFALGGEAFAVTSAIGSLGEKLLAVGSFLVKLAGNAAFGMAVVARSLMSHVDGATFLIAAAVVFAAAFVFLSSRRIARRRNA